MSRIGVRDEGFLRSSVLGLCNSGLRIDTTMGDRFKELDEAGLIIVHQFLVHAAHNVMQRALV